jgi:hypothetical protein
MFFFFSFGEKEKEMKIKREPSSLSPLPFGGRSEIICGTRWAAAADLIDCAPNDRKIT